MRRRIGFAWGGWLPIAHRSAQGAGSLCLSFDDGPSPRSTPRILELLADYGASATFFLSGERAEQRPDLVERIVAARHPIYAHGFTHERLDRMAPEAALAELDRAEQVLARFRPTPRPYLVRLPYGSGHRDPRMHRLLRTWSPDCQIAHWDYDFKDFAFADGCTTKADLEARCDRAVRQALADRAFRGAVALLHDDAIGAEAPLNGQTAGVLLEKLLLAMRQENLIPRPMAPVRPSVFGRFVRTVPMD